MLSGRIVILAAGAAETPSILLRSTSREWPQGLANGSGLVGRNLMRHLIDLHLFVPQTEGPIESRQKELAFNDFYVVDGMKLGTVQSFGSLPPGLMLATTLQKDIRNAAGKLAAALFAPFKGLVAAGLEWTLNRGVLLASILEDLPYAENRIVPSRTTAPRGAPRYLMHYTTNTADQVRIQTFRRHVATLFKGRRHMLMKQTQNNQLLGHICGTCRFGIDPATSVLDPENRAHGFTNLYVVDASFFPSSAGTNPSLTIAANALRVAQRITGSEARNVPQDDESSEQQRPTRSVQCE